MNFLSLVGVELKKIRRSKILLILLIPVIMMWIPSIINADMNFDLRGIPITPENNFFIQGFMGMVWFMIPASLVICTVLLNQTERSNKGILKMLSLPISTTKLCLAKFTVLILLAAFQMGGVLNEFLIISRSGTQKNPPLQNLIDLADPCHYDVDSKHYQCGYELRPERNPDYAGKQLFHSGLYGYGLVYDPGVSGHLYGTAESNGTLQ